ncbi:MAG TPA: ClpXP protease specificity-enhancing factor SspB [Candidatus Tectomicrobia bacterium]
MSDAPTSKEAVVLKLLSEGDTMLCLDACHQGVRVPPQHANNHALRLILNLNFPQPIEVTAQGVSANLAFDGRRYTCYIPMEAVWAAFNPDTMQGMMWPDSMPAEVKADLALRQQQEASQSHPSSPPPAARAGAPTKAPKPRGRLRPVTRASKKTADQDKTDKKDDREPPPPRQRGHLRIVK